MKIYPLTFEQEALWLDDHLRRGPSCYLESWVYRLSGFLDVDVLEWAIGIVVERHEVLRSRFTWQDDQLVQIVVPGKGIRLRRRQIRAEDLASTLRALVSEPLNLDDSALRATFVRLTDSESVIVIQFHHIVVDDWALAILGQELGEVYTARVQRRPHSLEPLAVQVGEYATAQRSKGVDENELKYWTDRLRAFPTKNSVPPDWPQGAVATRRGNIVRFRIPADTGRLVRQLGRAHRTTPFTAFATALAGLIGAYNDVGEMILGTPISRRGAAELDGLIGCFTDLLPLRLDVRGDRSFADLLTCTRTTVQESIRHRDIPYSVLAGQVMDRRKHGTIPLCQTALVVDDAPQERLSLPGIETERLYVHSGMSKFDICLTLVAAGDEYLGFLEYASDRYARETAQRVAQDFQAVLAAVVANASVPLSSISSSVMIR